MKISITFLLILFHLNTFCQIQLLNDEFDNSSTLSNWENVTDTEGWNAEHLEVFDINTSTPGRLHLMPYSTGWFEDYRSTILFKKVSGDFVFTTQVTATNRSGDGIPSSSFSLAGPMIRAPRNFDNGLAGWSPGGENYVFLSIGYGQSNFAVPPGPGPHFEVKTTTNSTSVLEVTPISTNNDVLIRIARIGPHIICLYKLPGQNWEIRNRYQRSDLPDTLQAGLVAYTDWWKYSSFNEEYANSTVISSSTADPDSSDSPSMIYNPDLIATFEFARFDSLHIPVGLAGSNFSNPSAVVDSVILNILGNPSQPYIPNNIQYRADTTGIEIYSDPINNFVNILGQLTDYTVSISNASDVVIDEYVDLFDRLVIDISAYPSGLYFIDIIHDNNNTIKVERILKE